jgi:predicted nucleic acid-binding protein
VEGGDGIMTLGVILQELLTGVRSQRVFDYVLSVLSQVPLVPLSRDTYVLAARIANQCRRRGVQANLVDFLIAAACVENGYPLLTADRDFSRIARHCELILLPPLP